MSIGLTRRNANYTMMENEQLAEELYDLMDGMESLVEKGITAKKDYEEFKNECRDILELWEEFFTDAEMVIQSDIQRFMEMHQETIKEIVDKIEKVNEAEYEEQHKK